MIIYAQMHEFDKKVVNKNMKGETEQLTFQLGVSMKTSSNARENRVTRKMNNNLIALGPSEPSLQQ